jgi:glycosyltransferase involved in cell wall biosynthesis
MRILMLSTHIEPCGIGDYNSSLAAALGNLGHSTEIVRIPRFDWDGLSTATETFLAALSDSDLGIIQHEWGFFGLDFRSSAQRTAKLLRSATRRRTPLALFIHSAFPTLPPARAFLPLGKNAKVRAARRAMISAIGQGRHIHVFCHGDAFRSYLVRQGAPTDRTVNIVFPVLEEERIAKPRLFRKDDEVNLTIFGFVSAYKGYETVLTALCLLPDNVKLIIAGGKHPAAAGDKTLDSIYGFLHTGRWPRPTGPTLPVRLTASECARLRARVHITGYLEPAAIVETIGRADLAIFAYHEAPTGSAALSRVLSLGRPIVASALAPFLDIQKQADCLRIVAPKCPFELTEAILDLMHDHSERQRLHENALSFARQHTYKHLAERVIRITSSPL